MNKMNKSFSILNCKPIEAPRPPPETNGFKKYVCGYLTFMGQQGVVRWKVPHILLVQKNRPTWQAGKWNGIGGKIEDGETSAQAMKREFMEEAALCVENWNCFGEIRGSDYVVYLYRTHIDCIAGYSSTTDEIISSWPIDGLPKNLVHTNEFVIPLALQTQIKYSIFET